MRFRRAEVSDAAAIARIHVGTWRTSYPGIVPETHLASLSYERSELQWSAVTANPDVERCVYVAEDRACGVVGFASAGPEQSSDSSYSGELYAIYLLAGYQRHGIGRKLTAAVAGRLLEAGTGSMLVWVLAENSLARRFYESLGGEFVRQQEITIGGATLVEVAYGWADIRDLTAT